MRERRVHRQVREIVIDRLQEGQSIATVASWTNLHKTTVGRISRTFKEHGTLFNPSTNMSGRRPELGWEDLCELEKIRTENPDLYFDKLAAELSRRISRTVTKRQIERAFHSMGITYKKVCVDIIGLHVLNSKIQLSVKFKQRCQEDVEAFQERIYSEIDPEFTWWLDEMRVDEKNTCRTRGFSKTSKRAQADQTAGSLKGIAGCLSTCHVKGEFEGVEGQFLVVLFIEKMFLLCLNGLRVKKGVFNSSIFRKWTRSSCCFPGNSRKIDLETK
ncbi:hypothetical protein BDR26DRAFT_925020 [Obelidium mucronatum]|nr:hypothetical protein BDR26DRAFT_925020 [Obelidium mucronatum]